MDRTRAARAAMSAGPFPDDLAQEPIAAKQAVEHDLEVVARGWIAVEPHRASRAHEIADLDQPLAHPVDVYVDPASPAILERTDLGFLAPNDFVLPVRKERRVEVREIDGRMRK